MAAIALARSLVSKADERNPCTASRPSVIASAACSNRVIKPLPGFVWTLGQEFRNRLEPEQQALKTLQQSVVQFARDARALAHPRLQGHIELVRELPDTKLISGPEQGQEKDHTMAKRNHVVW